MEAEAIVREVEQRFQASPDALAAVNQEHEVTKAVATAQQEVSDLQSKLAVLTAEQKAKEAALKETHSKELALKDELIARYADMKAKLSVKLLGETLEQHCEVEFNRIRSLAFPNATFGKDNDASAGTKGDYVFRDFNEDGVEYISIMFEMKNEADTSASKKRNTDFFAKLDKDPVPLVTDRGGLRRADHLPRDRIQCPQRRDAVTGEDARDRPSRHAQSRGDLLTPDALPLAQLEHCLLAPGTRTRRAGVRTRGTVDQPSLALGAVTLDPALHATT